MLILNNEPSHTLMMRLSDLPIDREDTYLTDIRGSMFLTLPANNCYDPFARMFGYDISLYDFIREDWKFRIKQKRAMSSICLTYFHPKLRLAFKFKLPKDWRLTATIKEVFVCGTRETWFAGSYATNLSPFPPVDTAIYVEKTLDDFTDTQLIDELHTRKVTKKKEIKPRLEKAA
jgi:hypothetical protein